MAFKWRPETTRSPVNMAATRRWRLTTRAESRRAYRETQLELLPRVRKGTCARPTCERNYRSNSHSNRYGVCPACLATVQTVEWLLSSGVLQQGRAKTQLEELGLMQPR